MKSRRTFLKLMTAVASALALPVTTLLPKRRGPKVTISDEPILPGMWSKRRYEMIGVDPSGVGFAITCFYETGADGEIRIVDRKVVELT